MSGSNWVKHFAGEPGHPRPKLSVERDCQLVERLLEKAQGPSLRREEAVLMMPMLALFGRKI